MAGNVEGGFFLVRWFRWLYQWMMHWADTPQAAPMLGVLSFAESSFFPIPPDVLLIPMAISRPDRAIRFGAITWTASVLGGIGGYLIGWLFFDTVGIKIIEFYGVMDKYFLFREWFDKYNFAIIMVAGLTPLPYKVFTITAGVSVVNFPVFVLGSILSRGIRFMAEAVVCYYGDFFSQRIFKMPIRDVLDRYINLFMTLMAVLGVAGFLVVKMVLPGSDVDITSEAALPGKESVAVNFRSEESATQKHAFEYRLVLAQGGSTVGAAVPGGPFAEPSRGEVELYHFDAGKGGLLIAAMFYSDLPAGEHGTDGHLVFYLFREGELTFLDRLDFARHRLMEGGAWQEGKVELTQEGPKPAVTVVVKSTRHAGAKKGEASTEQKKYQYRLAGKRLIRAGG